MSKLHLRTVLAVLVLGQAGAIRLWAHPGLLSDDFDDNTLGPLFALIETDPNNCWLDETSQRLEFRATSKANQQVATYAARDWHLKTDADFQLQVDFYFYAVSSYDNGIFISVAKDAYPATADDRIALAAGTSQNKLAIAYQVAVGGTETQSEYEVWGKVSGTLYVSYDATLDRLYLSHSGYGPGSAWRTVSGVVQGAWSASQIRVGIGGVSTYLAIASGAAYLDNFLVEAGTIVHAADADGDLVISEAELAAYVGRWTNGDIGDFDILDVVDLWAAGQYHWDAVSMSFEPGPQP